MSVVLSKKETGFVAVVLLAGIVFFEMEWL
jgi:hypothetical protein